MEKVISPIRTHIRGANVRRLDGAAFVPAGAGLMDSAAMAAVFGIHVAPRGDVSAMRRTQNFFLDAVSTTVSADFLRAWLPGIIGTVTAARKADQIFGVTTVGSWEDSEIVSSFITHFGFAEPYGDTVNTPQAGYNFEYRASPVVQFETGAEMGVMEGLRQKRAGFDAFAEKRRAALESLEMRRNKTAFLGWQSATSKVYGVLNNPDMPAWENIQNGAAGSPNWVKKTFDEIIADVRHMVDRVRTTTREAVDLATQPSTLTIPTSVVGCLDIPNKMYAMTPREWLKATYPQMRIESAPEFDKASGAEAGIMLCADSVSDDVSTDDGAAMIQVLTAKAFLVGSAQYEKAMREVWSNALGGIVVKRPYAMTRWLGA